MKKIISAVILTFAFLFGAVQPASAATPSLGYRTQVAHQQFNSCLAPYTKVYQTRAAPAKVRTAAFNVGRATCSTQVYKRYTSKYRDMYVFNASLRKINNQYHYRSVLSLRTESKNLYNWLIRTGYPRTSKATGIYNYTTWYNQVRYQYIP